MRLKHWIKSSYIIFALSFSAHVSAQTLEGPPLTVEWIGPTLEDRVGDPNLPIGNGINDLCLAVDEASMLGGMPIQWSIYCDGMLNRYRDFAWPPLAKAMGPISIDRAGGKVYLYIDSFLTVAGDQFRVMATFGDGRHQVGHVMSGGIDFGKEIRWLGQSEKDLVGKENKPDGCDDWEIEVRCPRLNAADVKQWTVWLDYHAQDDYFQQTWSGDRNGDPLDQASMPLKSIPQGRSARLYINPALAREGDQFAVQAVMDDGSVMGWVIAGGGTDWGTTAIYHGRGDTDLISEKTTGPNGINDISLEVFDPALGGTGIRRAAVITDGIRWTWPDVEGDDRFLGVKSSGNAIKFTIDHNKDRGGAFIFACAVLNTGKMIGWSVMTSRTTNSTDATWLGQLADYVGPGQGQADGDLDLAVQVKSPLLALSEPVKWRVEGAGRTWGAVDTGATAISPVAIMASASPDERAVYFSELLPTGNQAIMRGEKFIITATLADGNVIHWRLASPGSPMLEGLAWERATRNRFRLSFDGSRVTPGRVAVAGQSHVWRSQAADGRGGDCETGAGDGRVNLALNREVSTIAPGERLNVEVMSASGVRHYGYLFAGSTEP